MPVVSVAEGSSQRKALLLLWVHAPAMQTLWPLFLVSKRSVSRLTAFSPRTTVAESPRVRRSCWHATVMAFSLGPCFSWR